MGQSGAKVSMEKSVILTTSYWNQPIILFQAGYQAESAAATAQSFLIPEFSLTKPKSRIPHHLHPDVFLIWALIPVSVKPSRRIIPSA